MLHESYCLEWNTAAVYKEVGFWHIFIKNFRETDEPSRDMNLVRTCRGLRHPLCMVFRHVRDDSNSNSPVARTNWTGGLPSIPTTAALARRTRVSEKQSISYRDSYGIGRTVVVYLAEAITNKMGHVAVLETFTVVFTARASCSTEVPWAFA